MTSGRAVDMYARTDLETRVEAASPQRLIIMLYDGAIKAMLGAKAAFSSGEIGVRGESISKAISIVEEGLRAALDRNAGGDIAANLDNLYEHISNRLLYANLKSHEASIDEALKLMVDLRSAWEQLDDARPAPASRSAPESSRAAALSYGRA